MSTSTENIPKVGESGARASDDLLEVARATGLRQHMHGVSATDARVILKRFVGALYLLRELPIELSGIAETAAEGGGFWRSCSGCHELSEGHDTGPYSNVFRCALGNGCSECGGIGAVWDNTDYNDMARSVSNADAPTVSATDGLAALIVRSACESDPADPDNPDTIKIKAADLLAIVESHAAPTPPTSAADAIVDWQPISTAPEDGRTLLLGYYNRAGKWRTVRGRWMSESYIAENWEDSESGEPGWFETSVEADDPPNCWDIDPTHWMPLPPAPNQERTSIPTLGNPS